MTRRNAFTLIELLVVIAIISLLVSILLPSLQNAKKLAIRVTCAANLHSQGTGMHMYMSDYDAKFPSIEGIQNRTNWRWLLFYGPVLHNWTVPDPPDEAGQYTIPLEPYVGSYLVFYCPSRSDNTYPMTGDRTPTNFWKQQITYHGFKTDGKNNIFDNNYGSSVETMDGYRSWMYDILPRDSDISLGRFYMGSHLCEGQNQLHPDCSVNWVDVDDEQAIRGVFLQS